MPIMGCRGIGEQYQYHLNNPYGATEEVNSKVLFKKAASYFNLISSDKIHHEFVIKFMKLLVMFYIEEVIETKLITKIDNLSSELFYNIDQYLEKVFES
jgi:DNA modification methylase